MKKLATAGLIAALTLSLVACSGTTESKPTATATPVAPSGDGVLRIGDLTPVSGELAPFAAAQSAGIELAAREVNEAGGYKKAPVEVYHRNAGDGDATVLQASFDDLVARGIDVIIAPASAFVAEQLVQMVKTSKANVAVVSLVTEENAPKKVEVKLAKADDAFAARLKQADPSVTELGYGVESYDATVASILAATVAKDDGGASITQGLVDVSNREGFACTSYGECLSALGDKQKIDYKGIAGYFNYSPKTTVAYFSSK